MRCCACGEPDKMLEGRLLHAGFENARGLMSRICKECATLAGCAWARKAARERVPPPASPDPTPGPAGFTEQDATRLRAQELAA